MYKAIIVDDHMPVIEYLTAMVPWENLGLTLIGACASGEEALHVCGQQPPDLLLTDIGMPGMNGLDLIEAARAINPGLKSVILSCHEDFQYAQRAVKLNVNDYILKETLRIEQVTDVLRQLTGQLNNEQAEKRNQQKIQNVVNQSASSLRTAFLRSLIDRPVWNDAEWTEKAETLGIPLSMGTFLPVLCMLDRHQAFMERFGGGDQLHFIVENALNEAVKTEGSTVITLDGRHYYILYPYPKTLKWSVMDSIQDELRQVQQAMKRYMKVQASFYIGEPAGTIVDLKKQIIRLLQGDSFRFYAGENQIVKLQCLELTQEDLFVHYSDALNEFRSSILIQNKASIEDTVASWIDRIERNRYPLDSVRSWILKITADIELKYTVMQHFLTNYNAELLQRTIYSIESIDHLREWLANFLTAKMEFIHFEWNQTKRKDIADAQRYIMTHLNEKIGMEEMARRLDLNPSHFSRIFKKETGETFVEFVTRLKMERAKELLDKSSKSVEEIAAELGFDNTSYFFKLFRSCTSLTPMEYRNRL